MPASCNSTTYSASRAALLTLSWALISGLAGACFVGEFVQGLPCVSDDDCGPAFSCRGGHCGGQGEASVCGNSLLEADEECDDGNTRDGDNCTPDCLENVCGDGYRGAMEECDEAGESASCTANCTVPACGDGVVDAGEFCDDGNSFDGPDDECTPACTLQKCGDGYLSKGEECDDVNSLLCTPHCQYHECGDGIEGPGEECDDGNNFDGDTCTSDCRHPSVCGDLVVDHDEECDDGNQDSTDGCLANCRIPRSCLDILEADGDAGDGEYEISPKVGAPWVTFCDMSTGGGGWTRIESGDTCGHLDSMLVAIKPAATAEIDDDCRPYTMDDGNKSHTYVFDVIFPPGFGEFYISSEFQVRANAMAGASSEIDSAYFIQEDWDLGYGKVDYGDVSFGSADEPGPLTSYAAAGAFESCEDCGLFFPSPQEIFTTANETTTLRIGWGESGPESEGWWPWWEGSIFVR